MDVLGARLTGLALDGLHQGRGLAADEGAAAAGDPDVEVEAGAQDVLAEEAVLAAWSMAISQVHHGQRVLVPDVDEALVSIQGEGANDHPLEHRVRITLHDRPVHESPGVALVAVAQNKASVTRCGFARAPLARRHEAGAATAALAGELDLVEDCIRGHLEEGLGEPRVGAVGDCVHEIGGVDATDVAHGHTNLVLVKRDFLVLLDPFLGRGILVDQALDDLAADDGLLDDLRHPFGLDLGVENAIGLEHHQRAAFAESVAARGLEAEVDLHVQPTLGDFGREGLGHCLGAGREAAGAAAHEHLPLLGIVIFLGRFSLEGGELVE